MRDLIVSVGTSLLTNWQKDTGSSGLTDAETLKKWLGRDEADPVRDSAETHTLHRLPLKETDRVHLLHSSTHAGRVCAQALSAHLERQCRECRAEEILYLSHSEPSFQSQGLRELVGHSFRIIRAARRAGRSVEICATGGFKPELAYLNLVGLLSGCPVHYVHEKFQSLITLPSLPVDWSAGLDEKSLELLKWLDEDLRPREETEARLKALARPDLQQLVAFEEEGCTLNEAGLALWEAVRQRKEVPAEINLPDSPRSPEEKINLSGAGHHRPAGTDEAVRRIAGLKFVESICYRDGTPPCEPDVAVLDAARGHLRARHSDGRFGIELLVETTARDERGAEHAAVLIREALQG